jgi:hypothetical protein
MPSPGPLFDIIPDIFTHKHGAISVKNVYEDELDIALLDTFLATSLSRPIGVAASYGRQWKLSCIALATSTQVLIIQLGKTRGQKFKKGRANRQPSGRKLLQQHLLTRPDYQMVALRMDRLAVAFYLDFQTRVTEAIDLLSTSTDATRGSVASIMNALGGETTLVRKNVHNLFKNDEYKTDIPNLAAQAWAVHYASNQLVALRIRSLPRINTVTMDAKVWQRSISFSIRGSDNLCRIFGSFPRPCVIRTVLSD